MKRVATLAMAVLLAAAGRAAAQDDVPGWLKNVRIRQAFDGGQNEAQPAVFTFVDPHGDSKAYGQIDLAVKYAFPDFDLGRGVAMSLAPAVEYHLSKAEALQQIDQVNKLSPAILAEFSFGYLKPDPIAEHLGLPVHLIIPLLFAKYAVNHDFTSGSNGGTMSLLAELKSKKAWLPGGTNDPAFIRWVPSLGVEYFDNAAIEDSASGTVLAPAFTTWTTTLRIYVELYPINPIVPTRLVGKVPLVVLVAETVRWPFASDSVQPGHYDLTSVEVNYYFDSDRHVAVGYTFSVGEDPDVNFVHQRRDLLGFKVKF